MSVDLFVAGPRCARHRGSGVRRFSTTEFEDFLRRVDGELKSPCTIVLIGGGAVGLKYKGSHVTTDLDLWSVSESSRTPSSRCSRH